MGLAKTQFGKDNHDSPFADTGLSFDKIDRYKWVKGSKPGTYMGIPKTDLNVDKRYQRDLDEKKAVRIAKDFSWPAFGVLIVAMRKDGSFYVIDGQHRLASALRRSDIGPELPCIVFEVADVAEEAKAFDQSNNNRKPMTATQKHSARVMQGTRASIVVEELVQAADRCIGKQPKDVRCVGLLTRLAEKDEEALRKIWPLIVEVSGDGTIHERVAASLFYVENSLENGESLLNSRWRRRVLGLKSSGIIDAANAAAAMYSRGGDRVWAEGVVARLNKGLQEENRLVLRQKQKGRPSSEDTESEEP